MYAPMLVMGLDTALQRCSVSILRDDVVLADESIEMERGHAEHLAPMAALALEKSGLAVGDLDRVGVVVGPGGFTGVRVALSFARGLGVGTGVKIQGVTSLAVLARGAAGDGAPVVAPVIDARRGQVYAALYDLVGEAIFPPFVSEPEAAFQKLTDSASNRSLTVVGSGASILRDCAPGWPADWAISNADEQIDAKIVARLAAEMEPADRPPAPLYLRAPDAAPGKPSLFDRAVKA